MQATISKTGINLFSNPQSSYHSNSNLQKAIDTLSALLSPTYPPTAPVHHSNFRHKDPIRFLFQNYLILDRESIRDPAFPSTTGHSIILFLELPCPDQMNFSSHSLSRSPLSAPPSTLAFPAARRPLTVPTVVPAALTASVTESSALS